LSSQIVPGARSVTPVSVVTIITLYDEVDIIQQAFAEQSSVPAACLTCTDPQPTWPGTR
jgi:hypothetical protein